MVSVLKELTQPTKTERMREETTADESCQAISKDRGVMAEFRHIEES